MKYSMNNGQFVCKEGEQPIVTNTISGKLAAIRTLEPEVGPKKLQLDLKSQNEDGQEEVNTLTVRLYADAACKILQCLYGIVDIIADKVITISLEAREGHSALIVVMADNEILPACGFVHTGFIESKILFIDVAVDALKRMFSFRKDVLVYTNADGVYPKDDYGRINITEVCDYIRELRSLGRGGELTVRKTSFTNPAAAKGYMKAISDISAIRGFYFTVDADEIEAIMEAYTCELPEETAPDNNGGAIVDTEEV